MCGFAGILDFRRDSSADALRSSVCAMRDMLVHRGPDDAGSWVDASAGIALGHRRLSIVDLSAAGHQPMTSASGRYVVAFNGEIYNFRELRRLLEGGTQFRGHSDTEVLLAAVETWGFEEALRRFNGMFSFALWDKTARCLFLARDRFGEKPLYYGSGADGTLLFGSELKALKAHPAFVSELDRDALAALLRFAYVPAPSTIFSTSRKLPPAAYLSIKDRCDVHAVPSPYWSLQELVTAGRARPFQGTLEEATERLNDLLSMAVRSRMVADVPLGAFLSGGIDSSIVTALMQANSEHPIKTFTIGFTEAEYNEAESARAVARHLSTEHTEHFVTAREALDVIPRLNSLFDEPFADSSQIPTFLVSRVARQRVTVALSGDAGDELFCGYPRYPVARRAWRSTAWLPRSVRRVASYMMRRTPDGAPDAVLRAVSRGRLSSARLRAVSDVVGASDDNVLYARMVATWQQPSEAVLGSRKVPNPVLATLRSAESVPMLERMMLADALTYLPDDILTKIDRASMGVSLEARVPLLDTDVVAFAWSLPESMKLNATGGKIVLRSLLARYVPRELFERPKMGFGVPIAQWLRGPLREWAGAELEETRLQQEGYFDAKVVRSCWQQHLQGVRNWQRELWPILMFQSWLRAH